GCIGFRREKYIPRGGPDGGDGGDGGDIILVATTQKNTLYEFRHRRHIKAENGGDGKGSLKHGRNGKNLIIHLPVGTVVAHAETNEIICDLTEPNQEYVIATGGKGGLGNKHFATSTNQAPRFAQKGKEGETLAIKLELKLIADVGIIGLPNAGKSTLLKMLTAAQPKVADYPFTTLYPYVGVVYPEHAQPFSIADLPGLIEDAHKGAGLGIQFLKHIERTRILLHLIDISAIDPLDPLNSYELIVHELDAYNPALLQKQQLIVLNKLDILDAESNASVFIDHMKTTQVISISALTGIGIDELKTKLSGLVNEST
ncbi:MAG: GTPase ObgE, partial [Desulfobacterales bacterium]|nr:GTPase ObgE [Desulfobacterales bacterium]